MAKKSNEEIEKMLEGIDFKHLTAEEITGPNGLIKMFTKKIIEKAMNAEMTNHLGYEKYEVNEKNSTNSRNGTSDKTVITENGAIDLNVPRDREGKYAPVLIKKHQRRFEGFNDAIISLYAVGMTTRDIQEHLREMYGVDVSSDLISTVTNEIIAEVKEWQQRPLDAIYPIVYMDAIVVKGRSDGKVVNKAVYTAIGVNLQGKKDVLGLWISDNEGASFWMGVVTELANRGIKDILIACIDGLKGLPEAINSVFPQTKIQLCIVHMVRNSTKFVSWKNRKEVCADLKKIYGAPSEKIGVEALEDFAKKWDVKYPMIAKSWKSNWENLNEFFKYPNTIRKAIYTTNAIESLNASLRKVTQKRSFPTDDAIFKVLYLALSKVSKKWTMPIPDWGAAINQFVLLFEGRIPL